MTKDWDNWNIYYASLSNLYVYNLKNALNRINQDLTYILSKLKMNKNMDDEHLLQKIKRIQEIMIEYSCWWNYNNYEEWWEKEWVWLEYRTLYVEIWDELTERGYLNKNKFIKLFNFFQYYKDKYWKYAERRWYIHNLYSEILDELELNEIREKLNSDDITNTLVVSDELIADDENITDIIKHSKVKYFSSSSSIQDKRDAIKALADCLEHYRWKIKDDYFVKKDEGDLFDIANNYWLRHLKKNKQKLEYDQRIFYDWIYLTYYNSLKLIIKLLNRNK